MMGHQNVKFLAGWADILEQERQRLRAELCGITSLHRGFSVDEQAPFNWDAHKRARAARKTQTIFSMSDDEIRKDRLKREKDEANSDAVGRSFRVSAPHKPTMHERLMPYRSRP